MKRRWVSPGTRRRKYKCYPAITTSLLDLLSSKPITDLLFFTFKPPPEPLRFRFQLASSPSAGLPSPSSLPSASSRLLVTGGEKYTRKAVYSATLVPRPPFLSTFEASLRRSLNYIAYSLIQVPSQLNKNDSIWPLLGRLVEGVPQPQRDLRSLGAAGVARVIKAYSVSLSSSSDSLSASQIIKSPISTLVRSQYKYLQRAEGVSSRQPGVISSNILKAGAASAVGQVPALVSITSRGTYTVCTGKAVRQRRRSLVSVKLLFR